jgi:hypothetical protein
MLKSKAKITITAHPSGPIPSNPTPRTYQTSDFLNGPAPMVDSSPMCDPAKEAAQHVPPTPK